MKTSGQCKSFFLFLYIVVEKYLLMCWNWMCGQAMLSAVL